ncbi:MAG: 50S ribosomal protein L11 methyltransferase [Methylococcales bacterium]|nr:50S ribosomal protein L11 methyltransferase [Methylococcales bacterium]
MTWHQLSVTTDENSAPLIADFFSELGAVSVTYMDAKDQPVYEPDIGETKIWLQTVVIGLYELDANPDVIKKALFVQFEECPLENWQSLRLEDQVWERTWMEHYKPMKFADKLWVCPTGQENVEKNTVCMVLDPGLAFGTGTHATTALCLEWLASHDLSNKIIIDYGCGSGILAIAAVLLGAKHAYAVDIDPQALTATQANAIKNKVEDKISSFLVNDFNPVNADIVLANILAKPLIELHDTLSDLVKNNGQLVLSGILNEQAVEVSKAYATQFNVNPVTSQEDWCRLDANKI